jgi:hypothetical protein
MERTPIPADLLSDTVPPHTHHPSTDYPYPFLSRSLCRTPSPHTAEPEQQNTSMTLLQLPHYVETTHLQELQK